MAKTKRLKLRQEIMNRIAEGIVSSVESGGTFANGIVAGCDQIVLFIQNNYRRRQK